MWNLRFNGDSAHWDTVPYSAAGRNSAYHTLYDAIQFDITAEAIKHTTALTIFFINFMYSLMSCVLMVIKLWILLQTHTTVLKKL